MCCPHHESRLIVFDSLIASSRSAVDQSTCRALHRCISQAAMLIRPLKCCTMVNKHSQHQTRTQPHLVLQPLLKLDCQSASRLASTFDCIFASQVQHFIIMRLERLIIKVEVHQLLFRVDSIRLLTILLFCAVGTWCLLPLFALSFCCRAPHQSTISLTSTTKCDANREASPLHCFGIACGHHQPIRCATASQQSSGSINSKSNSPQFNASTESRCSSNSSTAQLSCVTPSAVERDTQASAQAARRLSLKVEVRDAVLLCKQKATTVYRGEERNLPHTSSFSA